jgi:phosphatidylinositol glycan class Z
LILESYFFFSEDIFDVEASRPWEFNTTKPIRSVGLPYLYAGIPIYLLKQFAPFFQNFLGVNVITPYFLLTTPRLMCCMLSFLNDWSLYK